jgi:NAD dependent epimerase/dehydratase
MALAAVTGADGFIGSHLVEALVSRGLRVRAMVLYNAFNSWGWLDTLAGDVLAQVEVVPSDVRDASAVHEFVGDADVVFHLAALIAIPYSYRAPRSYLDTNAGGTLNVLEAARSLGTPRVVQTSTSEVYGTARTIPIDEDHPLQGQSPYSASKIAADKLAEAYHLSFEVPVVTLRPFNTYGPRQSARAVIPTIITQLAAGQSQLRLGLLSPTRDFNYVSDTVEAFIAVAEAPADAVVGRVFNAGSGTEIAIGDLARRIGAMMARDVAFLEETDRLRPPASEVHRLQADAGRLRAATGWSPRLTLDEGLERTIAWFAEPANLAGYRWSAYNV